MIFKMVTGKVPFPGTNITTVFPLILQRKIDWPKDMKIEPKCQDLIEKLLQPEPTDRLGCKGTDHGMSALKAHPFFEGIDWTSYLIHMSVKELLKASEPLQK
jgi:3-phosphoinositide dependent protein kinase-1